MADSLFLDIGGQLQRTSCKIHPLVIFSILDHYARASEFPKPVIGSLLGILVDGVVEVTNCFPVPSKQQEDSEDMKISFNFNKSMLDLHLRANPQEMLLGWYSTIPKVDENIVAIHKYYWNLMGDSPIYLSVDTSFKEQHINIKTFISNTLQFSNSNVHFTCQFNPIPHSIHSVDVEKCGFRELVKSNDNSSSNNAVGLTSDLDNLTESLATVTPQIDRIISYIKDVQSGAVKSNNEVGRKIVETLSSLPKIDRDAFEKMCNNNLQDLLMVIYLANLTRTQLKLADKLQSTVNA